MPTSNSVFDWRSSRSPSRSLFYSYKAAHRHPLSRRLGRYVSRHPGTLAILSLIISLCCFAIAWTLSLYPDSNDSDIVLSITEGTDTEPVTVEKPKFQRSWQKMALLAAGNTPQIDRDFLRRLGFSDDVEDMDDKSGPLAIYDIPESGASVRPASYFDEETYDMSFCGYHPCRILLPMSISDHGSKAQLQFLQIVQLAVQLNRTLVLPNVGKTRMGTCFKYPFATLYDVRPFLGDCYRGLKAVTFGDLTRWVAGRLQSPNTQIVVVVDAASSSIPNSADHIEFLGAAPASDRSKSRHKHCLRAKIPRLETDSFSSMVVTRPAPGFSNVMQDQGFNTAFSSYLLNVLSSPHYATRSYGILSEHGPQLQQTMELDVLAIDWDLRESLFDATDLTLDYSSGLTKLADSIHSDKSSFLAVYWHIDEVLSSHLTYCAEALVQTLQDLLTDPELLVSSDIQTVWLLGDYDSVHRNQTTSPDANAQYFKDQHQEATSILRRAFSDGGSLQGFKLQSMSETMTAFDKNSLRGMLLETTLLGDAGVINTIENIIALKADLFVTAGRSCAKPSVIVKEIVDNREHALPGDWETRQESRNIVQFFE